MSSASLRGGDSNQNDIGVRWELGKVRSGLWFWRRGEKKDRKPLSLPSRHLCSLWQMLQIYFLASWNSFSPRLPWHSRSLSTNSSAHESFSFLHWTFFFISPPRCRWSIEFSLSSLSPDLWHLQSCLLCVDGSQHLSLSGQIDFYPELQFFISRSSHSPQTQSVSKCNRPTEYQPLLPVFYLQDHFH